MRNAPVWALRPYYYLIEKFNQVANAHDTAQVTEAFRANVHDTALLLKT